MGLLDVLSANPYVAAGTVAAVGVAAMALSRKKQSDHPEHIPLTMPTKVYDEFVAAMPDEAIAGKVVAITGCTSGVGYFAALTAAQKGAKCVFLLNRPSERASMALASISSKGADGCEVVNIPCDLSDFGSVKKAAATVAAKAKALGGLNALACNAAVMMSPEVVTKDGFDVGVQTNHHAHVLLISLLMPALQMGSGRLCTTGSMSQYISMPPTGSKMLGDLEAKFFEQQSAKSAAGALGGNGFAAAEERYHQTKLGQVVFAMALAEKLAARGSAVKAVAYDPGWTETSLPANTVKSHRDFGTDKTTAFGFFSWRVFIPTLNSTPAGLPGGPCHGAPDASASLLTALFASHVSNGDYIAPKFPSAMSKQRNGYGPPIKIMANGARVAGVGCEHSHDLVEKRSNRELVWKAAAAMLKKVAGQDDLFANGI